MKKNNFKIKEIFFTEDTGVVMAILGIFIFILALLLFLWYGNWNYSTVLDEAKVGQFGDLISGVVGSFFSLAGIILFYVALKEQRKDININQDNLRLQTEALNQQVEEFKAQKKELEDTRKVYEEQTLLFREQTNLYKQQYKELKEQTATAKLQHFDSNFFSVLNVFLSHQNNLNKLPDNSSYFENIRTKLKSVNNNKESIKDSIESIKDCYLDILNKEDSKIAIYLKTIYRIMESIENSSLEESKKWNYFKILRSQISETELVILFFNYQTDHGIKVRSLVLKYEFFKHLRPLDRIVFKNDFEKKDEYKIEDNLVKIEKAVLGSLKNYNNLEVETDIDISYIDYMLDLEFVFKILIKEHFECSLFFDRVKLKNHSKIKVDYIKELILRHLYSVLYISKFKTFQGNEIINDLIEKDEKIEIKFKIINIKNI